VLAWAELMACGAVPNREALALEMEGVVLSRFPPLETSDGAVLPMVPEGVRTPRDVPPALSVGVDPVLRAPRPRMPVPPVKAEAPADPLPAAENAAWRVPCGVMTLLAPAAPLVPAIAFTELDRDHGLGVTAPPPPPAGLKVRAVAVPCGASRRVDPDAPTADPCRVELEGAMVPRLAVPGEPRGVRVPPEERGDMDGARLVPWAWKPVPLRGATVGPRELRPEPGAR
jgi:hypothetical protein